MLKHPSEEGWLNTSISILWLGRLLFNLIHSNLLSPRVLVCFQYLFPLKGFDQFFLIEQLGLLFKFNSLQNFILASSLQSFTDALLLLRDHRDFIAVTLQYLEKHFFLTRDIVVFRRVCELFDHKLLFIIGMICSIQSNMLFFLCLLLAKWEESRSRFFRFFLLIRSLV